MREWCGAAGCGLVDVETVGDEEFEKGLVGGVAGVEHASDTADINCMDIGTLLDEVSGDVGMFTVEGCE